MNKQQLASKIWESANKMRSKIEANEYKDYILGFIFYKFLSEKEVKVLKEDDWDDEYIMETLNEAHTDEVENIQRNLGYFISYDNLFSTWLSSGRNFNVSNVSDALSAFNRLINATHKNVFDKIFDTLQTGLSKLGDSSGSQTKAISDLIHLINDIPMDGSQDYDVLGFIYEYLISNFAANAGKKAGEFYTPHEVSLLMSEIVADHLKNKERIKIYDPTSGSGSLLINIGKAVSKYMGKEGGIQYYAQELKENTYNLTRMNLIMRGILPDDIKTRNADTLEDDWPYFNESDPAGTYEPLFVDAVVSNPPYSQQWNPADKDSDERYKAYGLAPKTKADYAFLLHDLYHVRSEGIMTIVLPHGVLFRGGEEGVIRKNLIERNNIDTIIGLPSNIFFGTGIPTIIMVLKKERNTEDILVIDASKGFEKIGKNNKLRACDIKKIVDTVSARLNTPKFSRAVSREEIRANDYNLNIPRYVDSSENAENYDIYASMFGGIPANEINELDDFWKTFPTLKKALFENADGAYLQLHTQDIKKTVAENESVRAFAEKFKSAFDGFDEYLRKALIEKAEDVKVSMEENNIAGEIFTRLADTRLVDKYEAYQLLDDVYATIAADLEIIQSEGFDATKEVDPNMVVKKKDNKEVEVQEGWKGHVIPFEIAQEKYFSKEVEAIKAKEERVAEILGEFDELLDQLSEEDKEAAFVNDDKTAFVSKEVTKAIKANTVEKETLAILKKVEALVKEKSATDKKIKKDSNELHLSTKGKIETLTDDEVRELLKTKWISPILQRLESLSENVVSNFVAKLEALAKKYETTFFDIETEIKDEEKAFAEMLDDLTGSESDMKGIAELKKLLGGE